MRLKIMGTALASAMLLSTPALAQTPAAQITIHAAQPGPVINRDIFGQFAEMLGEGVMGGIWVGKESPIPNVRGIRSDVVAALRAIKVPNVRWPGGCFADKYNWRSGIGPAAQRRTTLNMWGNVSEPNSFGTDEYFDFLDQIGSEAYLTINLGSAPPQDAADWLEYMTAPADKTTLGRLRATNGHPAPYKIKYLGLGNEAWGCGGNMTADYYVNEMKRYASFAANMNPVQVGPFPGVRAPESMQMVAVGPDSDKPEYTEAVMRAVPTISPYTGASVDALSLHFYASGKQGILQSPATGFSEADYAYVLKDALRIDGMIAQHSAIMDTYDPKKRVALSVDEWGAWYKPMDGHPFLFLRQQNTVRDAIVAALTLNIFARHADRVRNANIAQMVNVIQSMILTDGGKMVLTPTYHVYKMYLPFQDATLIPADFTRGVYQAGGISLPQSDGIAARGKDGSIWLALTNLDPNKPVDVATGVDGMTLTSATGQVLTGVAMESLNSFDHPDTVAPRPFTAQASGGKLVLRLPPKSVVVVRVK